MNAKRFAPFASLAIALVAPCAEGAVKAKDVPPLLLTDAGKTVSDAKEWESARRGELRTWFLENEYGVPPAAAGAARGGSARNHPPPNLMGVGILGGLWYNVPKFLTGES